eukprot:gnl/MRDRNA2_/MRDRNA2_194755_c0_seq1.p1 gnl/MRDRNA2_/MRDRNA2_194755_c0~~gnl/MRDRNA2_/MRDRNA2_194755_c0_seq1.p1  ORF type:complete len:349 (+),score=68.29 gnl/MRDRNA2_/MRDRNA2_194755_c0_seq1:72-1118(+)
MAFAAPRIGGGSNWTEQLLGHNEALSASWYLQHGDGEPLNDMGASGTTPSFSSWMTPQENRSGTSYERSGAAKASPLIPVYPEMKIDDPELALYVANLKRDNAVLVRRNAALLESTGHLRSDVAMALWEERDRAFHDLHAESVALRRAHSRLREESAMLAQGEEALAKERNEKLGLEIALRRAWESVSESNSRNDQLASSVATLRASAQGFLASSGNRSLQHQGAVDVTHHYDEVATLARAKESAVSELNAERLRNKHLEFEGKVLREELHTAREQRSLMEMDPSISGDVLGALKESQTLRKEIKDVRTERERHRVEANRLLRVAEGDLGRVRGERAALSTILTGSPW